MRELRDLTRTSLRQDHTAVANGMQKILEEAHVKIASVATDWLGVCGRKILQQMLDGEPDSKKLADVCRGRLREKIPERELALEGRRTSHHRWMLRLQREQLEFLERRIEELDIRIQDYIRSYQQAVDLCVTIAGIEKVAAANWIAEIGIDMDPFPSAQHLASWSGLCPGGQRECRQAIERKARH